MSLENIKDPSDIYNLSDEEFENLDVNQLMSNNSDNSEDEDQEDLEDQEAEDNPDSEDADEDSEEDDQDDELESEETPEDDAEDSEHQDEESDEDETNPVKLNAPAPKKKADKADKQKAEEGQPVDSESLATFHKTLTAPLKAAGHEFTFDDPNQIRELVSKGIDYTRKMQQISHLRGIGEILRENDMMDAEKLAYAIDLANHKPEAIARLIKESGLDTYDLGEDKADSYQVSPVNIDGKAKAVMVREIVESYQDDANFNALFQEARTWDNESQVALVNNPEYLHLLAAHANNGVYKQVMAKVMQERALTGTSEPILAHYDRVGKAMFATENDGGHAQAPQNQAPAKKERVVIKRKSVDETQLRKSLAPTATTTSKKSKRLNVTSKADIYSMSDEDFEKLDPDVLRKFSK